MSSETHNGGWGVGRQRLKSLCKYNVYTVKVKEKRCDEVLNMADLQAAILVSVRLFQLFFLTYMLTSILIIEIEHIRTCDN